MIKQLTDEQVQEIRMIAWTVMRKKHVPQSLHEDVTQECFLRILHYLPSFDPGLSQQRTWLFMQCDFAVSEFFRNRIAKGFRRKSEPAPTECSLDNLENVDHSEAIESPHAERLTHWRRSSGHGSKRSWAINSAMTNLSI